jgi:hypothetical protein
MLTCRLRMGWANCGCRRRSCCCDVNVLPRLLNKQMRTPEQNIPRKTLPFDCGRTRYSYTTRTRLLHASYTPLTIVGGRVTTPETYTPRTRLVHASYTPLTIVGGRVTTPKTYTPRTRLLHASYTPPTRLLHASYTPLTGATPETVGEPSPGGIPRKGA